MYLCMPVYEFVLMNAVHMEARGGTEASASRVVVEWPMLGTRN